MATISDELVARIRNGIMEGWSANYPCLDGEIAEEAANRIEEDRKLIQEMREALEYANKGLDMVHGGLMDPTRPRQSVGEVCNHFLQASTLSLSKAKSQQEGETE